MLLQLVLNRFEIFPNSLLWYSIVLHSVSVCNCGPAGGRVSRFHYVFKRLPFICIFRQTLTVDVPRTDFPLLEFRNVVLLVQKKAVPKEKLVARWDVVVPVAPHRKPVSNNYKVFISYRTDLLIGPGFSDWVRVCT